MTDERVEVAWTHPGGEGRGAGSALPLAPRLLEAVGLYAGRRVAAGAVGSMRGMRQDGECGERVPREGGVPEGLGDAMDRVLDDKDAFVAKSRAGYEYWSGRLSP